MQYKSIPDVRGGGRLRTGGARGCFLREERGFTLTEMMVTIVIFTVILSALYSLFDMSVKVFMFGNNKAEAMANARLGLEKMEREIRQAYAFDRGADPPDTHLLNTKNATQIEFGNDLDGNGIIECTSEETCEIISYSLDGETLMRTSGGDPQPVVEHVDNVEFTYFKADGTTATNEPDVALVRIDVGITVDPPGPNKPATQELTTEVDLRNR
jgi:prepilin-type N-terminal cleavage/methylation domain-containing protein